MFVGTNLMFKGDFFNVKGDSSNVTRTKKVFFVPFVL